MPKRLFSLPQQKNKKKYLGTLVGRAIPDTVAGVEKQLDPKILSMVKPEKAAPVTETTLRAAGPAAADFR